MGDDVIRERGVTSHMSGRMTSHMSGGMTSHMSGRTTSHVELPLPYWYSDIITSPLCVKGAEELNTHLINSFCREVLDFLCMCFTTK